MNEAEIMLMEAKEAGSVENYKKNIYSVKDEDMGFLTFEEAPNNMIALRNFANAINAKDSMVKNAPEKYSLWFMGTLESMTGKFESHLRKLGEAKEYIKNELN